MTSASDLPPLVAAPVMIKTEDRPRSNERTAIRHRHRKTAFVRPSRLGGKPSTTTASLALTWALRPAPSDATTPRIAR